MSLIRLGRVVGTPAAVKHCEEHGIQPIELVYRHSNGDWGEIDEHDRLENIRAVQYDQRVLSVYIIEGVKLYCITEADRSYTTLMIASEY